MNIEALEQLKRVVSDIPDGDLNMRLWICGTQACALGHAAMDPWFNERGLKLVPDLGEGVPFFKGCHAFKAASLFFEISSTQSAHIFESSYYEDMVSPTRAAIIGHIDDVLNSKEPT